MACVGDEYKKLSDYIKRDQCQHVASRLKCWFQVRYSNMKADVFADTDQTDTTQYKLPDVVFWYSCDFYEMWSISCDSLV